MYSKYRGIAQLVEQRSPKPRAEGSSPSAPAIKNETDTARCPFCFLCCVNDFEAEARGACRGVRVSGGDLCEAEAPTEPAGEIKSFCTCHQRATKKI